MHSSLIVGPNRLARLSCDGADDTRNVHPKLGVGGSPELGDQTRTGDACVP